MSAKFDPRARRQARIFALQALYQWQMTGNNPKTIAAEFRTMERANEADWPYFLGIFEGVIQSTTQLEKLFSALLDRDISQLDPIELALLRLSTYELSERRDIPPKVIINEAIELAKMFGASESYKYINGVLDKLAQQLKT